MQALRLFFVRVFAPLYNRLIYVMAYGAWGPSFHRIMIRIFCATYKIPLKNLSEFSKLGDFFLRDEELQVGSSNLVSPAESKVLTQAVPVQVKERLHLKGLVYQWNDMPEFQNEKLENFYFWNLYLAPSYYHWLHFPCDLSELETMHCPGAAYPVNKWGLSLCPFLYSENERFSFRGRSKSFGRVYLLAIAALGVSGFQLADPRYSHPDKYRWKSLGLEVSKAQKALGFRLGSSALLLTENLPGKARSDHQKLKCAENLLL